jgi:type III pantothenate kinase
MLLAVDVGNTNIVIGAFRGETLAFEARLKTDVERTRDEYAALIKVLVEQGIAKGETVAHAILSSVVPPLTDCIKQVVSALFGINPLVVDPTHDYGVPVNIEAPSTLGSDRIVNAVAAKHYYGAPCIVVDFGTATTFDVLGKNGAYDGGVICPGISVSLESLVSRTSKLPRIELVWPDRVVGKNTVQAMQSGSLVGYLCLVDGIIDKIVAEIGQVKTVVATGGNGKLLSEHSKKITKYEPHLTLQGLRIIAEKYGR